MIEPQFASNVLANHILLFVDNWFKDVFKHRVFNSKSELLISKTFNEIYLKLKIHVLESNVSKGLILPYFTQIKYELVQSDQSSNEQNSNDQKSDLDPDQYNVSESNFSICDSGIINSQLEHFQASQKKPASKSTNASKGLFKNTFTIKRIDINDIASRPIPLFQDFCLNLNHIQSKACSASRRILGPNLYKQKSLNICAKSSAVFHK